MKRFAKVALLAAMMFGVVSSASALEVKNKGSFDVYGQWSKNLNDLSSDSQDSDNNSLVQRARMYFDFISSKNLHAVIGFEMDSDWGIDSPVGTDQAIRGGKGGSTSAGGSVEVKHAYLDFVIPETVVDVKAGLQTVALPSIFGSPILDDDAAALMVSAPVTDMVGITAGFVRAKDTNSDNEYKYTGAGTFDTQADVALLAVPVKTDAFSVTPYAAYGWYKSSAESDDKMNAYWLGANAALTMFDPFTLEGDIIYGSTANAEDGNKERGWYGALAASYKFDMVTPVIFGTYASGDNDDTTDGSEVMPTISEGWGISPFTGSRAFSSTWDTWALSGSYQEAGLAMWTAGVQLKDITFVDKLSHSLTFAYLKGTSNEDSGDLMNKGSHAVEVYLANKYMIYENLAAIVELDYFSASLADADTDPAAFIAAGFQYKF